MARKRIRLEVRETKDRVIVYDIFKGARCIGECFLIEDDEGWYVEYVELIEEFQRKGIYSHGVLPRLADKYGKIRSSTTRKREWYTSKAWEQAGGKLVGDRYVLEGKSCPNKN